MRSFWHNIISCDNTDFDKASGTGQLHLWFMQHKLWHAAGDYFGTIVIVTTKYSSAAPSFAVSYHHTWHMQLSKPLAAS